MPGRDDETGRYRRDYPDEAFLHALREHDGLTAASTVAETVGCEAETARRRLSELAERGHVERLQPSRSIFWRLADEPDE